MRLHKIDLIRTSGDSVEKQATILGQRFGAEIRTSAELYQAFYSSMGIAEATAAEIAGSSFCAINEWYPRLAVETRTLAATIGLEIADLMAVIARTEVLVADPLHERSECSTAVVTGPDQRLRSIQTWDWHKHLVPAALIRKHRSAEGIDVATFTEFGAPAKIGINSAGLGLNFNILHHRSDHTEGGVPVHAIARRILDEATTVDEAIDVASSANPSASTALTVCDRAGKAISIEVSPAGISAVGPNTEDNLVRTNHFIDTTLSEGESTADISTTYVRLAHLKTVADSVGGAGPNSSEMAVRLASQIPGGPANPISMIPDRILPLHDQWMTLLTVVIDPGNQTMISFAGCPDQWNTSEAICTRV